MGVRRGIAMTTRRTVYLYPDDLERLKVLKASYGLGTSAACRAGVALLLAHLQDEDRQAALGTTVGDVRRERKEKEMKYHLILTPRDEHKALLLPVGLPYAEAITIRDTCLGEIATVPEVAARWADVGVVPEGWPNVNRLGVPD